MDRILQEICNERLADLRRRLPTAREGTGDPQVQQIVEAAALLLADVEQRMADLRPDSTEGLLSLAMPHLVTPVPACAIAQFLAGPELRDRLVLPRGTALRTPADRQEMCEFQTTYDLDLWPIHVAEVRYEPGPSSGDPVARAMLRLRLKTPRGLRFADLKSLDTLRFFLGAGDESLGCRLVQALFLNTIVVSAQPGDTAVPLTVRPVGFQRPEALLPWGARTFAGYRLLTEYFAFLPKFLFVDLSGLASACQDAGDTLEIQVALAEEIPALERIRKEHFALGCTPLLNLFEQVADSLQASPTKTEHRLVIDPRRPHVELCTVERVDSWDPKRSQWQEIPPLYGLRHAYHGEEPRRFWHLARRMDSVDGASATWITLIDTEFQADDPVPLLRVRVRATDGDLPARLPVGTALRPIDPELAQGGDFFSGRLLTVPTPSLKPPSRRTSDTRLSTHLALNQLAAAEPEGTARLLRRLLAHQSLLEWEVAPDLVSRELARRTRVRRELGGIGALTRERDELPASPGGATWRGQKTVVEVADDAFPGEAPFLFAACLDQFFGLAASISSFSRIILKTSGGMVKSWPPRSGERVLP